MSNDALPSSPPRTAPRRRVADLDPELRQILGPPPLYQGESEADYNLLYDRLRSAVSPTDLVEEFWVRDVVDLFWETLRFRRLKAKLMDGVFAYGLERFLGDVGCDFHRKKRLMQGLANDSANAKEEVDQLLKAAGIDKGTLRARAFAARLDDFERIDRLVMQSEGRRHAVLREIDRYRDAVARRFREALADVEDAEFEEVLPSHGQAAE